MNPKEKIKVNSIMDLPKSLYIDKFNFKVHNPKDQAEKLICESLNNDIIVLHLNNTYIDFIHKDGLRTIYDTKFNLFHGKIWLKYNHIHSTQNLNDLKINIWNFKQN